jgi:nucleoside transporter
MANGGVSTAAPPLDIGPRLNLSGMMFIQFAIWGSWFVVFTTYLGKLGFSGTQQGLLFGNMALGAIISPMIVGLIADRWFASERLMALLHFAGAGLLVCMAYIQNPGYFAIFYVVSLAYALVYNPTLALANSITFHHVPDATRDFPGIRVLGTIGWIAANLVVGKALNQLTNQPLLLAAGLSALLGVWSWFLPHTPPSGKPSDALPFVKALALFKDFNFAVFFLVSGIITVVLAFYYSFAGPFLAQHTKLDQIPSWLSFYFVTADEKSRPILDVASTMLIGQICEIGFLLLLPFFLGRIGMKGVLALGMLAWGIRYALFSLGDPFGVLLVGVALHGICFDFFFAAGFIHVDNTAPKEIRASGQALFAFLTYGVGMWLGSMLSGVLKDFLSPGGATEWEIYWMIPSAGVMVAFLVFVIFFNVRKKIKVSAESLAHFEPGSGTGEEGIAKRDTDLTNP